MTTITIPKHAHPLVKTLFEEMNRRNIGFTHLARITGLAPKTIRKWDRHSPAIQNLDACFVALGMELVAKSKSDAKTRI